MKSIIVTTKTSLNLDYYNNENFFIIGVERGCLDLIQKGIKIDLAISDFDHVTDEELELIKNHSRKFTKLNNCKDFLDGEVAIEEALKITNEEIIFITKATKRYDMNFSIFYLIKKYNIKILNDDSIIFAIPNGKNIIEFYKYQDMTYVSFFALEDNTKISIKNMKYQIEDVIANTLDHRMISNAFLPYQNPEIENNKKIICILSK